MCACINEKQKIEDLGKKYIFARWNAVSTLNTEGKCPWELQHIKATSEGWDQFIASLGEEAAQDLKVEQNGDPMSSSRDRMINWVIWRDRCNGVLKAIVYKAVRIVVLSVSASSQGRLSSQKILVG